MTMDTSIKPTGRTPETNQNRRAPQRGPSIVTVTAAMFATLVVLAAPTHAATSGWVEQGFMFLARGHHTATVLQDGSVLVTGGNAGFPVFGITNTAERFFPSDGWHTAGSMAVNRTEHVAASLPDGTVLVAGGENSVSPLAAAEIYHPTSNNWSTTDPMAVARSAFTATTLSDGRILVVGGDTGPSYTNTAEIFDPDTHTWSDADPMTTARSHHTATLLDDGRVLVTGGRFSGSTSIPTTLNSAEIYDPQADAWTDVPSMSTHRTRHAAVLLPDGDVLVSGGDVGGVNTGTAELFHPVTNSWSPTGSMVPRQGHTATLLRDGSVLVAGRSATSGLADSQLYDPASGTFADTGDMTSARLFHTATLLPNGKVLAVGGQSVNGFLANVEEYEPPNDPPVVEPGSSFSVAEGDAGALNGSVTNTETWETVTSTWTWNWFFGADADAACTIMAVHDLATTISCDDDGTASALLSADDGANPTVRRAVSITVTNVAPTVDTLTPAPGATFLRTETVPVSATFTDPGTHDTHVCSIDWGDGLTTSGSVAEASGAGTCTGSHSYATANGYTVAVSITDDDGDHDTKSSSLIVNDPANSAPEVDAGEDVSANEGSVIALDAEVFDDDGDDVATTWSIEAGAPCSFADTSEADTTVTCTDDGSFEATLTGTDGIADPVRDSVTVSAGNVAPLTSVTAPMDGALYALGATTSATADFTDAGTSDTHSCTLDWGDTASTSGTVVEAVGAGTCTASHTYATPGVYSITATIADDDGASDSDSIDVVVYDPSVGFVTGGGWISSPAGAFPSMPELIGKATFGFVSRYEKGARTPTGDTAFKFAVADLSFDSTAYDWLVVGGAQAQFKGRGTVNGRSGYGFLLTAIDGALKGGGGSDTFRIKIWNVATGAIVYDNQATAADTAAPTTPIGGGSVVIHKK